MNERNRMGTLSAAAPMDSAPVTIGGEIRRVAILTTRLSPVASYLARRLQPSGCEIYIVNQLRLPVEWNSWKFFWRLLKKRGVRCCLDNILLHCANVTKTLPGRCRNGLAWTYRAVAGCGAHSPKANGSLTHTPGLPPAPADLTALPPSLRPDPSICQEPWLSYVEIQDMNRKPDQDVLRAIAPDLMLVAGGPILFGSTIALAKVACLNAHCGITPDYGGNSPAVWALYEGRFADIGFTIHQVVPAVDAGPVLWQQRVRWDPAEPLSVLWPDLIHQMVEKLGDIAVSLAARHAFRAIPQGSVRALPPAGFFTKKIADYRRRRHAWQLAAKDRGKQLKPAGSGVFRFPRQETAPN